MSYEVVEPRQARGLNMSLIPPGPKWAIACGGCPATFVARLPKIDNPTVKCPHCRRWNRLTGLTWGLP